MTYFEWIHANVADPLGKCREFATAMTEAFPELRLARGYYYDTKWGPREHWWCVAPDGSVVDPTASQFPTLGAGVYDEMPADAEEPIGQCLNCGEYSFESNGGSTYACSIECSRSLDAFYGAKRAST